MNKYEIEGLSVGAICLSSILENQPGYALLVCMVWFVVKLLRGDTDLFND